MNLNNSDTVKPKVEETQAKNEAILLADYTSSEDDSCEEDSSSDEDQDYDSSFSLKNTPMVSRNSKLLKQMMSPLQKKLVNSVLNEALKLRFDGIPGITSHAGSDQTSNSASSSAAGSGYSEAGRDGGGRKRGTAGEPPSRGGGDNGTSKDDPNKRQRRHSRVLVGAGPIRTNLACPYYKRNPDMYRDKQSCPGPGWPSVSRLKYEICVLCIFLN